MCGTGSGLGSSQVHPTIYTHTISGFNSLPRQDSLFPKNSLTTTLADALGLPRDCDCEPRLVRRGNLWKPVGHGRLDYHIEVNPLRFSLRHYEGFQWILGRRSNISVDPIKHALNQR